LVARISIRSKTRLYMQYSRAISRNMPALGQMGFRVDMVDRIYTVINIPMELFGDAYDVRASDMVRISQSYLSEYLRGVSRTLDTMGMNELYRVYDTTKVDKYSFLVVIGFSLFDTGKVARWATFAAAAIALVGLAALIFSALQ